MRSKRMLWEMPLGATGELAPDRLGAEDRDAELRRADRHRLRPRLHRRTLDDYLRAFDARTGKELWSGRLPAGGQRRR